VDRKKQLEEILELAGLTQDARRPLRTYSGGMKRRVGIAQALLGKPQLLIVDEPTSGLDPEERVRLRNLLAEMSAHCTVILSTHIVEDVSQSCNDLAVINLGQVLFRGSAGDLIAQARGHVWNLATSCERPEASLTVVSTMQLENSVHYRVVGNPPGTSKAVSVEPSLEDGYIWLMQKSRIQG
jgi:ABC-type multidrug transport system ATPase subunit